MFEIKEINEQWYLFKNKEHWIGVPYITPFEAIQELYDAGYENEALELQLLFEEDII